MTSREVLRRHAKTFFWAWLLLPRDARRPVADLYAFCRHVDDLADGGGADSGPRLDALRTEVETGVHADARRFESLGVKRAWLLDLIDGARSDVDFEQPATEADLNLYCYRVAGVVGLMMCPLLGVHDEAAHGHARDLGHAMQLTNIARDVAEDLDMGRVYVPRAWGFTRSNAPTLVRRLLERADELYASGANGYSYLPWRARLSIAVAARIYRAIGDSLARQDFDPFRGRAHVGAWRKLRLTAAVLLGSRMPPPRRLVTTAR